MKTQKKIEFIMPPNTIKAKIGSGGLSSKVIEQAQTFIEKQTEQFDLMVAPYLDQIEEGVKTENIGLIKLACFDLKANGAMFKYDLISHLADQLIIFLNKAKTADKEILKISLAFHTTMTKIIDHKLKHDGGKAGQALTQELSKVCKRYVEKHS